MIQLQLSAIVFQNSSPFLNMQDESIVGKHIPLKALLSNTQISVIMNQIIRKNQF